MNNTAKTNKSFDFRSNILNNNLQSKSKNDNNNCNRDVGNDTTDITSFEIYNDFTGEMHKADFINSNNYNNNDYNNSISISNYNNNSNILDKSILDSTITPIKKKPTDFYTNINNNNNNTNNNNNEDSTNSNFNCEICYHQIQEGEFISFCECPKIIHYSCQSVIPVNNRYCSFCSCSLKSDYYYSHLNTNNGFIETINNTNINNIDLSNELITKIKQFSINDYSECISHLTYSKNTNNNNKNYNGITQRLLYSNSKGNDNICKEGKENNGLLLNCNSNYNKEIKRQPLKRIDHTQTTSTNNTNNLEVNSYYNNNRKTDVTELIGNPTSNISNNINTNKHMTSTNKDNNNNIYNNSNNNKTLNKNLHTPININTIKLTNNSNIYSNLGSYNSPDISLYQIKQQLDFQSPLYDNNMINNITNINSNTMIKPINNFNINNNRIQEDNQEFSSNFNNSFNSELLNTREKECFRRDNSRLESVLVTNNLNNYSNVGDFNEITKISLDVSTYNIANNKEYIKPISFNNIVNGDKLTNNNNGIYDYNGDDECNIILDNSFYNFNHNKEEVNNRNVNNNSSNVKKHVVAFDMNRFTQDYIHSSKKEDINAITNKQNKHLNNNNNNNATNCSLFTSNYHNNSTAHFTNDYNHKSNSNTYNAKLLNTDVGNSISQSAIGVANLNNLCSNLFNNNIFNSETNYTIEDLKRLSKQMLREHSSNNTSRLSSITPLISNITKINEPLIYTVNEESNYYSVFKKTNNDYFGKHSSHFPVNISIESGQSHILIPELNETKLFNLLVNSKNYISNKLFSTELPISVEIKLKEYLNDNNFNSNIDPCFSYYNKTHFVFFNTISISLDQCCFIFSKYIEKMGSNDKIITNIFNMQHLKQVVAYLSNDSKDSGNSSVSNDNYNIFKDVYSNANDRCIFFDDFDCCFMNKQQLIYLLDFIEKNNTATSNNVNSCTNNFQSLINSVFKEIQFISREIDIINQIKSIIDHTSKDVNSQILIITLITNSDNVISNDITNPTTHNDNNYNNSPTFSYLNSLQQLTQYMIESKINYKKSINLNTIIIDDNTSNSSNIACELEGSFFLKELTTLFNGMYFSSKDLEDIINAIDKINYNANKVFLINAKLIIIGNTDISVYLDTLTYPVVKVDHNHYELFLGNILVDEIKNVNLRTKVFVNSSIRENFTLPLLETNLEFITSKQIQERSISKMHLYHNSKTNETSSVFINNNNNNYNNNTLTNLNNNNLIKIKTQSLAYSIYIESEHQQNSRTNISKFNNNSNNNKNFHNITYNRKVILSFLKSKAFDSITEVFDRLKQNLVNNNNEDSNNCVNNYIKTMLNRVNQEKTGIEDFIFNFLLNYNNKSTCYDNNQILNSLFSRYNNNMIGNSITSSMSEDDNSVGKMIFYSINLLNDIDSVINYINKTFLIKTSYDDNNTHGNVSDIFTINDVFSLEIRNKREV